MQSNDNANATNPASPLAPDAAHGADDGGQLVIVRVTPSLLDTLRATEPWRTDPPSVRELKREVLRAADAGGRPLREVVAELLHYKTVVDEVDNLYVINIPSWEWSGENRAYYLRLADATLAEYAAGGKDEDAK